MPKIEAVLEGRFRSGGRNRTMQEIVYGPNKVVVWPVPHTYVVLGSPQVYYTSGYSAIAANGSSSRAFISARVQEYAGDTPIGSPYNQVLEVRELVGNVKDTYVINGQSVALDRFYVDSDGAVCGNNLMDHSVPNGYSISVRCGLGNQTFTVTVSQQANTSRQTDTQKVYDGYTMTITNDTFGPTGGTATIGGIASFTTAPVYTWTSGETSLGPATPGTESVNPTNLYANRDPMSAQYPRFSGMDVTFPINQLGVNITYRISGQASLGGVTYSSSVNAYVQETAYSYDTLTIQSYGYATIPASGGTVYPGINFKIKCYENGVYFADASGTITNGAKIGYAVTSGGFEVAVNVNYYVGSSDDPTNGRVSADSLGTTATSGTTAIKSNLRVTLSKGSVTASGGPLTVYQARNKVESTSGGSMNIRSFSASATPSPIGTAGETVVVIHAVATGGGTTPSKTYTSGAVEGGGTVSLNNDPVTPTSLTVNSVSQSVTTQFTASNNYNTNAKSYSVTVEYYGAQSSFTVSQVADQKVPGTATYHATLMPNIGSNTISAGGGSILLVAEAWHISGLVWESDGTGVQGESQREEDIDTVTLNLEGASNDVFWFTVEGTTSTTKTFRLWHRDMKKVVTTDSVTAKANNNGALSSSASFSASNARGNTPYESEGEIVWGPEYAGARAYQVAFGGDIIAYSFWESPAPFVGVSNVGYTVSGSHEAAALRDGVLPLYTDYRYDSWSADKDDDEHRDRTTEYDYDTYAGQLAPGSSWTRVYTDPVVVQAHDTYNWLTINTTTKKISIARQPDYASRRSAIIDFYNANDPSANGSETVYQNAWANLSISPNQHNFSWEGGAQVFIIDARYTKFSVTPTGNWIGVGIRPYPNTQGQDYVYPTGEYGDEIGNTQFELRVSGTINDEDHNPTGYTHQRIAQITLTPTVDGVSTVYVPITQDPYDGGLPTD